MGCTWTTSPCLHRSIGSKILLDDGLISLQVTSIGSDSVTRHRGE